MRIIDTQRLHLRPLGEADEPLYCRIYTDPELMRHVGAPLTLTAAQRSFGVACRQAMWPTNRPWWVMSERDSHTDIGVLGLVRHGAAAQIGILMFAQWQGRGFATEVITVLSDLAFRDPGLAMLGLDHAPGNGAMLGLMEKLEFLRDGPVQDDVRVRWQLARRRWQAHRSNPCDLASGGAGG